jgi:hypothetical protein
MLDIFALLYIYALSSRPSTAGSCKAVAQLVTLPTFIWVHEEIYLDIVHAADAVRSIHPLPFLSYSMLFFTMLWCMLRAVRSDFATCHANVESLVSCSAYNCTNIHTRSGQTHELAAQHSRGRDLDWSQVRLSSVPSAWAEHPWHHTIPFASSLSKSLHIAHLPVSYTLSHASTYPPPVVPPITLCRCQHIASSASGSVSPLHHSRNNNVVLLRDTEMSKEHCKLWRDARGHIWIQVLRER